MTDSLQEDLLGYLLNALDDERHAEIERQLDVDPEAREQLEILQRALAPLDATEQQYEPPSGLAEQTCRYVLGQPGARRFEYPMKAAALVGTAVRPAPTRMHPITTTAGTGSGFHWQDLLMAGGIFIAACLLLFPAIHASRVQSRMLACQDNLRELGSSLTRYSEAHDGYFPKVPTQGNLAAASAYAPILAADKLLPEDRLVVCPGSSLAESGAFRIPSLDEIESITSPEAVENLQQTMGGSYGYSLGYQDNGQYSATRNLRRAHFAIASDAPPSSLMSPRLSENHGRQGQNVLFEDGHVQFTVSPKATDGDRDDFFLNDDGLVAAGVDRDDAVIGAGATPPIRFVSQ